MSGLTKALLAAVLALPLAAFLVGALVSSDPPGPDRSRPVIIGHADGSDDTGERQAPTRTEVRDRGDRDPDRPREQDDSGPDLARDQDDEGPDVVIPSPRGPAGNDDGGDDVGDDEGLSDDDDDDEDDGDDDGDD